MPKTIVVVPCYNEAKRLYIDAFQRFLPCDDLSLLFVDDGSSDETAAVLGKLVAALPGRAEFISLERNQGKAEAVRRGMRLALERGADVVGYYDADCATPPEEMIGLVRALEARQVDVAIAARVAMLGTHIERQAARHYMGRVFATMASLVLRLRVYDTQCGAKVFRRSEALARALEEPFASRWAFDVELLARLTGAGGLAPGRLIEVPLRHWRDVAGSKVRFATIAQMAWELVRIARRRNRRPLR